MMKVILNEYYNSSQLPAILVFDLLFLAVLSLLLVLRHETPPAMLLDRYCRMEMAHRLFLDD